MSRGLSVADFAEFLRAVHGYERLFGWQQRLLDRVYQRKRWPRLVDLPTGAGKTTLVDIAVFLMALDGIDAQAGGGLWMPRRIVLVVDRRVVVDQVGEHVAQIVDAFQNPPSQVVQQVKAALQGLSGGGPPLVADVLRGGIVRDDAWASRPDVPTVISSTVDQVGSRLLFRGYGVSPSMRPVHAGLLASDTLLLLDEVHLSQPFAQTLQALAERYQAQAKQPLAGDSRWQVVELSATPGNTNEDAFRLDDADRRDPVLRQRLAASKPVALRKVTVRSKDPSLRSRAMATACAEAATELLAEHEHVRTLGVVVNRVDTARETARLIRAKHHVLLLTGRMRPFDRDDLWAQHGGRLRMGRQREASAEPFVVVATQCIEAGADLDLDGMVTECASLDALRQRFGRVDRAGELWAGGTPSRCVILAATTALAEDDFVYGSALAKTWAWLESLGEVDFGIERLPPPPDDERQALLAPKRDAPLLFPAHLDAWVQTNPGPQPDPDISLWLHGMRETIRDVQVVWRADLTEGFLRDATLPEPAVPTVDQVIDLLAACSPGTGEAATVPLRDVRQWLARAEPGPQGIADVEGARASESAGTPAADGAEPRWFMRWRGDGGRILNDLTRLRPGDVVVVPSGYGGLSMDSWDPASDKPVSDLGERVQREQRDQIVLRLIPPIRRREPPLLFPEDVEEGVRDRDAVAEWLREALPQLDVEVREAFESLPRGNDLSAVVRTVRVTAPAWSAMDALAEEDAETRTPPLGSTGGTREYFVASVRHAVGNGADTRQTLDTEPENSSFTGAKPVLLHAHGQGVAQWARQLAERCGLPQDIAADLELAGELHDLGKADPRFQLMLHGGDEVAHAMATDLLAKSGMPSAERAAARRARERSGYPKGARHELLSVALVADCAPLQGRSKDWDLVLHLIASHHGWCRPFAPAIPDPSPRKVPTKAGDVDLAADSDHGLARLDAGVPERFWRLVRRYGWFGLAWLEAILRLADHRQSEAEAAEKAGKAS